MRPELPIQPEVVPDIASSIPQDSYPLLSAWRSLSDWLAGHSGIFIAPPPEGTDMMLKLAWQDAQLDELFVSASLIE